MLSVWLRSPTKPTVQSLGLARFEEDEQGFGVRDHGVAVTEPAGYEDLSAFHPVDPRIDFQLLIDRDDLTEVDVKVRRALAWTAGDHPGRHAQDGIEQQPERTAVNGAVAAQMKPSEAGPALDAAVVSSEHSHRHRQDVAAVRQVDAAPGRGRPLIGIERAEQLRDLFDQVGRLADHLVGRIDRTGMVLQRAYRLDEPAVVRAALARRFGRIETTTRMSRMFAGHQNTVLPGGERRRRARRSACRARSASRTRRR